ncbi:MAG: acyl-CoA dehydrogenase family protein [Pyrinomonadaceae bacterium]|nr:acyl-CoA dehydrogenase family protein [Pyrinomonadaceae bacterium]MCX7639761.1 acyl-CoA dehydrogenase family protein [Pyrinomonadaceae bacterium]MDW8304344.1 acyl-CoA dehydrogenase family protein [Acidobacteriota bacterium]
MTFELNEEQLQIKYSVREFAESEIRPHVMEWDETQHFPIELLPKLAELGLMGIIFPEEYGGAGLGYVEYATIIEELGRVDASIGLSVAAHNSLCSNHIYMFGSEKQKQKYLIPLVRGEHFGAWGLTEAQAGSDASGTKTTAIRSNGGWIVNGSKNFITHAISCQTLVAVAVTDKEKGNKGISAFIFDKTMQGFRAEKKENKLGMRASETASVVFEDCYVPEENLLGNEGEGFLQAMQILDGGRISIAALAVGIAQGAYEAALKYAKERVQFGRPIAEFQAIQFKLADMATQIEAARLLTLQAAAMKDAGKKVTKYSSMAKLFASEIAVKVAEEAIQIHGGYGYTKDYPVEKYWRDSKLCTIGEGTSEIQRLVIAKQILKSNN